MDALLRKDYEAILTFGSWSEIKHVLDPFKRFYGGRQKSNAVRDDGKVLRIVVQNSGYNDKFLMEGNVLTLQYVCGNGEETRRLHKLRSGDNVRITIDQKAMGIKKERHGILHGQFIRIEHQIDTKADGEFLVPRAILRILGFETSANVVSYYDTEQPVVINAQPTVSNTIMHMMLDTESAAPAGRAARQLAFPILEVAYKITGSDLLEEYTSYRSYVKYPEQLRTLLGNDASSAVLKFNPEIIAYGEDVKDVLTTIIKHFKRVHASGGAIIGHNILHDLRQLKATADLVGFTIESFPLNVFDTVRSANSFVANAELRWMKLAELAQLCQVNWDTCDVTRGQHRAAGDVDVLHKILKTSFDMTHFRAFYELVSFP